MIINRCLSYGKSKKLYTQFTLWRGTKIALGICIKETPHKSTRRGHMNH
jgi:hypothetical protein